VRLRSGPWPITGVCLGRVNDDGRGAGYHHPGIPVGDRGSSVRRRALVPDSHGGSGLAVATAGTDVVSGLQPLQTEFFAMGDAAGIRVCVQGPLRDLVLTRTLGLLERPGLRDRLRRCPECHAFFLRVKRQAFCSDRCKSLVNFRRRQKPGLTPEQRVRRAERAHRYYAKKQQQLHGPRVKVQRRPRLKLRAKPRQRRKTR
jgi:hypothetical protein